jgi:hypothetical protein
MKTVANSPVTTAKTANPGRRVDLFLLAATVVICVAALLVRIYVGSKEFMDFDEWQQVFMSATPRWSDFTFEVNAEAHPPLFFLLLRWLMSLGHSKLLYRSISIAFGTASVFLMWWIGRKVFRSRAVAVLAAGILALSAAAITIAIEVRQYQLLVFLLLLAFSFYLEIVRDEAPTGVVHYAMFSAVSALAVLCHYSAIVFLGACVLVSTSLARRKPRVLSNLGLSLLAPVGVFAYLYFSHARYRPLEGYLYDFYFRQTPNESLTRFVLRNSQNFWNLFSPVEIHNRAAFLIISAILCAACVIVLRRNPAPRLPAIAAAFGVVMSVEMLALSIARKYPFGGLLRHQYLAGPFLILTALVVLDRLIGTLNRHARRAVLFSIALMITGNLIARARSIVVWPDLVLYSREYDTYKSMFPNPEAVYVDHWGVIGYYIHTDQLPRRFIRRITGGGSIDEYHAGGKTNGVEIFYDKGRSTLDMSDPSVYRAFALCLKQAGIRELTLFLFEPGDIPFRDPPGVLQAKIVGLAAAQGLSISKIAVDSTTVFAGFVLN